MLLTDKRFKAVGIAVALLAALTLTASAASATSRVFVTSTTYDGNLGEGPGADAKCSARAAAASLGGDWMAWISDNNNPPNNEAHTRLINAGVTGPFVRAAGTAATIASDMADLTDGTLTAPILNDELGNPVSGAHVWTGSLASGVNHPEHCAGWANATAGVNGAYGISDLVNTGWTGFGPDTCDTLNRLYCFEVPTPTPAVSTSNNWILAGIMMALLAGSFLVLRRRQSTPAV